MIKLPQRTKIIVEDENGLVCEWFTSKTKVEQEEIAKDIVKSRQEVERKNDKVI